MLLKAVYGRFDQFVKICKRHPFPLFAKKARKLKNQSPRCPSFWQIMKVENFIFSPFRLVQLFCRLVPPSMLKSVTFGTELLLAVSSF